MVLVNILDVSGRRENPHKSWDLFLLSDNWGISIKFVIDLKDSLFHFLQVFFNFFCEL